LAHTRKGEDRRGGKRKIFSNLKGWGSRGGHKLDTKGNLEREKIKLFPPPQAEENCRREG